MFKPPQTDICQVFKDSKGANFVMKGIINVIREKNPGLFHKCPYIGLHNLINFSVPNEILGVFPTGLIRVDTTIIDDSYKPTLKLIISLVNEVKN